MSKGAFKVVVPAHLEKSKDGEMRIYGLASTDKRDLQGETIDLKGLDLTEIKKGKGTWTWDHQQDPESRLGIIDKYKLDKTGLYLGGYLFKNHSKAKAVHEIMSSLSDRDKGRVGISVEGVIRERAGRDGKIIKKAVITSAALTLNPVNTDTYCDLVKSLSSVEFFSNGIDDRIEKDEETSESVEKSSPVFTVEQVYSLLQKALGASGAYATSLPQNLSQGDAMAQEDLDHEAKKSTLDCDEEELQKNQQDAMCSDTASFYKSSLLGILDKISRLYPNVPRTQLWEAVRDRLYTRYPALDCDEEE